MSIGHIDGHRELGPGRSAYWQAWLPSDPARAVVVIVHGFGEHSARYGHVGTRLAVAGFAAYGADHRGHHPRSFQDHLIGSGSGNACT
ncbi:MAG: serine aminopeptidase domain-containing protein [Pseudonocardiaceae bacterium]